MVRQFRSQRRQNSEDVILTPWHREMLLPQPHSGILPRSPDAFCHGMALQTKVWARGVITLGSQRAELGSICVLGQPGYTSTSVRSCLELYEAKHDFTLMSPPLLRPPRPSQPSPLAGLRLPSPTVTALAPAILHAFPRWFNSGIHAEWLQNCYPLPHGKRD